MPAFCTPPSLVTSIQKPTGKSHAEMGQVTLANGASFDVWGYGQDSDFVRVLRTHDRLELCFGPELPATNYGTQRPVLVVNDDEERGDPSHAFLQTLGRWPRKK